MTLISRKKSLFPNIFSSFFCLFLNIFQGHVFLKCHLRICTDVYLCRLGRSSCWGHCVSFAHHMTAVPAYLGCKTCACLCSRTQLSTELLQLCAVLSLHLPAFTGLAQLPSRNPDWRPKNHAQQVRMTLCLSAVQVHSNTGWDRCMYVHELEVLVFSHESERQKILIGQLCVSTNIINITALIKKNRVEKFSEVSQRVIHMWLNDIVNNSQNSRRACCSTCVNGA